METVRSNARGTGTNGERPKNVALLGLGLQGRAALYDLVHHGGFDDILAVDGTAAALGRARAFAGREKERVRFIQTDLSRPGALTELLRGRAPGVVVDLTPIPFIPSLARQAVEAGWHYVNTYYTLPELRELAATAERRGVVILPECGFDPGIDLVLAGEAARAFDTVTGYLSYGAGVPAPEACTNPLFDVPFAPFIEQLATRGIRVSRRATGVATQAEKK